MNKSVIITVLDFFEGEVDIFQTFVSDEDTDVEVQDIIEERGHHIQDCHYMFSDPNKIKIKVDL